MKVISTKIIKGKKHYLIDDEEKPLYQSGGVIEDDRGQWAYPGEVTKINSPNITMKGVPYPVLGVSDAGDTQLMQPNGEYTFRGNNVTEYPIKAQRGANVEFSEDYVLDDHKQFLKNWYQNRIINDPQFQKGFIEDKKEINKKLNSFPEYKYEGDNYIFKKGKGVITGYYDPSDKTIKLARKAPKFTKTHELDHYISDAPLYSNTSNETVINNEIIPAKQREGNYKDSYYSDPNEVHARLMVLRKAAKLKPDEFVTPERLGKFFENYKPGDNENIDDLINIMKDHKGLLNMLNYTSDNLDSSKKIIKAQKGYNVPIQGINSSDNTRTKLTPKTELIPQQLQQIVNSQTSVKAMADKVSLEKATRLKKADVAYKKRQETGMQSSEDLADETGAIGDKISLQNLPKIGKYIPDMLDATGMIGNMASGLGKIPLNLEQRNYGQAALSVAMPLGLGALAGIGNPNTGQFVNNLANPLAGTGDLAKNVLREGVDLIHPVGRQLKKINKEGLAKGLSPEAIKNRQMQEVGITSLQREGYFPGVSEVLSEYFVPYSYDNAKKRLLDIPKKIIKGDTNTKRLADLDKVILDQGENTLAKPRYDAWRMYSGLPQKHGTFRMAETSPINHPSYTQNELSNLEKFSLNDERRLLTTLPNEYDNLRFMYNDEDLLNNVNYLKDELKNINTLQQKGIDFPQSDFTTTNVMGGHNRRFFDNKMEYNDVWDLDLNGLKVEKYYGKPFLSHGQLEYSLEPAKNTIERLLSRASNMERNINISKDLKNIPDFNVKNYNFLQDVKKVKRQLGGTIKVLDTKIEKNKKYYLINE